MRRVRLCHCTRHEALHGRLLRTAAGPCMRWPGPPSAGHLDVGSTVRGAGWWLGREHVRQMCDGRGVPQVHVGPQEGGSRGASVAVRGGPSTFDATQQCRLLRALMRARGRLCPGAWDHLGALRAPVGACRHGGGHRVMHAAEVAGVREVGGRRPGVGSVEPAIIPALTEGVPELQQAGADAATVVSNERLLPDCLPRVRTEHPMVVECRDEVIPLRARVLRAADT